MRRAPDWPAWGEATRCFYAFGVVTIALGLSLLLFGAAISPFTSGIADPAVVLIVAGGATVIWGALWAAFGVIVHNASRVYSVDITRARDSETTEEATEQAT